MIRLIKHYRFFTCFISATAFLGLATIGGSSTSAQDAGQQDTNLQPRSETYFADTVRPLLEQYCGDCHAPGEMEGLDFLSAETEKDVPGIRGVYASVVQQIENRTMPPSDSDQLTDEERTIVAAWIKETLSATACDQPPFAPVVTSRRLNRSEYQYTVRDLVGVDLDVSDTFPVDGSGGEGFDNNGETLFLPPMLMERYLETAGVALDRAIVTPLVKANFPSKDLVVVKSENDPNENTAVGFKFETYVSANYDIIFRFADTPAEGLPKNVEIEIDGIVVSKMKVPVSKDRVTKKTDEIAVKFNRGTHIVRVIAAPDAKIDSIEKRLFDSIGVKQVKTDVSNDQKTAHEKLLGYPPGQPPESLRSAGNRKKFAAEKIEQFARRAFRRPVNSGERKRLIGLYERGEKRGDPFEESVKLAMKGVLVSPSFLFRVETAPENDELTPLDAHSLATRLSYFLWSTMPDDELARLADSGEILKRDVLSGQIDRMLADDRSARFCEHFIGQWLGTNQVSRLVAPSVERFEKEFSTALLIDIRQEPVEFFAYMIEQNSSVLDFLNGDYSVQNKRLKKHYELKSGVAFPRFGGNKGADRGNNKGGEFGFTKIDDERRRGLLGMSAVHLVTSRRDRTSPVLRGAWVLETMLGVRVPPPPPDVPAIFHNEKKSKRTLREKLKQHRDNPSCAACHNLMDPVGFSLENFDVLGRWREKDAGHTIDATGKLPNGKTFEGPQGLKNILVGRSEEFVHHLTRKVLGYALGRSLSDRDDCVIQQVANSVKQDDYRIGTMIREVVLSVPFRNQQLESKQE
ncbi:MAG: DUF1592 domain-containing protein [Mariniblastus sp.]